MQKRYLADGGLPRAPPKDLAASQRRGARHRLPTGCRQSIPRLPLGGSLPPIIEERSENRKFWLVTEPISGFRGNPG